jgi:acetyltransferase-like isoleucine patch superfamily enzyme
VTEITSFPGKIAYRLNHLLGRSPGKSTFQDLVKSGRVTIGAHSYGEPDVLVYTGDSGHVHIGRFCAMATGIEIFVGGGHRIDTVTGFPMRIYFDLPGKFLDGNPCTKGDVVIGNDVWLGKNCRLLSGVHVGNGAVVGAYTVVASDVRAYAVMVGNPGREVRRRFTDEQCDALEAIAWWNWSDEVIRKHVSLLSSPDIEGFISRCSGLDAEDAAGAEGGL